MKYKNNEKKQKLYLKKTLHNKELYRIGKQFCHRRKERRKPVPSFLLDSERWLSCLGVNKKRKRIDAYKFNRDPYIM